MADSISTYALSVTREVHVTSQDIDDIMATALDSITYWCGRAKVKGNRRLGKYASEQISRGGTLILYDAESDDRWNLTLEKFLHGLEIALEQGVGIGLEERDGLLCVGDYDGEAADAIVQFALFREVVFS